MIERTFGNCSIEQLEKLFDEKRHNRDFLESILSELGHRSSRRARRLKDRIVQALAIGEQQ